jgi:hypothetical protein
MKQAAELKVFISTQDSSCGECGAELGHKAWITLDDEKGALCLSYADLEHLIFLPAGAEAFDFKFGSVAVEPGPQAL